MWASKGASCGSFLTGNSQKFPQGVREQLIDLQIVYGHAASLNPPHCVHKAAHEGDEGDWNFEKGRCACTLPL